MPTNGTFYIVTAYERTHLRRNKPIDARFVAAENSTVFYLVDPTPERTWPIPARRVVEHELSPTLGALGREHMGEWSFLLNEYEHGFATYPFYVISSRFYEKNPRLVLSLDQLSDFLFAGLARYGWGYLPSYNRPPGYEDLLGYSRSIHLGITTAGVELIRSLYGVDMLREARWFSDFFCNYIGFQTREQLVRYVDFYRPLLEHFFDANWQLRQSIAPYSKSTGTYHKEKPLTFLFEMASHLFFFKNKLPFFGFHPEGLFEIREHEAGIDLISDLPASIDCREAWGLHLLEYPRYDLAYDILQSVIREDPTRTKAVVSLLTTMIKRGELLAARDLMQASLSHHPQLAEPLMHLSGEIAAQAGKR